MRSRSSCIKNAPYDDLDLGVFMEHVGLIFSGTEVQTTVLSEDRNESIRHFPGRVKLHQLFC